MASDKNYVTATGFIQFDPIVRDANGKTVTDVTIKLPGGDKTYIKVTIWPEMQIPELEQGDWLAVDGPFTSSTYQDKDGNQRTGLQISAYVLNVNGVKIARSERTVETSTAAKTNDVPF